LSHGRAQVLSNWKVGEQELSPFLRLDFHGIFHRMGRTRRRQLHDSNIRLQLHQAGLQHVFLERGEGIAAVQTNGTDGRVLG